MHSRHEVDNWLLRTPETIIMQPTSLCPLACTYCYLPDRHVRQDMTTDIAEATAAGIAEGWGVDRSIELVWHGGEPLAVGRDQFLRLIQVFEPLRLAGRVQHMVQTSATMITHQWCDLFECFDVKVGISVDGPRSTNRRRVDRAGHPAFDRAMAGVGILQQRDFAFTILAVIGQESTDNARSILDFLSDLGSPWVGLNIEAKEAANAGATVPTINDARRFWRDVLAWSTGEPPMKIREVEWLLNYLAADQSVRSSDARHDLIPTIGWNGDVVLLSPELLGVRDENYENFEHGKFSATETEHCRASFQAPVLALADILEKGSQTDGYPG